jgi:hypothetical protein
MERGWSLRSGALLAMAVALPALAAGQAPVAEVWPWAARRLEDGRVEYAYDLTGLKAGISQARTAGEVDPEWVKSLAGKLPDAAHVVVDLSAAAFALDVSSGAEPGEPVPSLATARSGERVRAGPLDEPPGPRLLPALHPGVARVLPSVDLLAWKARLANASLLSSLEQAADEGRVGWPLGLRAFWVAVAERSLSRVKTTEGDAQEGAALLAAHVAAALERQAPLPGSLGKGLASGAATSAVFKERRGAAAGVRPLSLRAALASPAHGREARDAVLALPLPESRAGKAAALTFLLLLEGDARLSGTWEAWQAFRRDTWGAPALDVLAAWSAVVKGLGGPAAALEDFPACVAALQQAKLRSPPLVATVRTALEARLEDVGRADLVSTLQGPAEEPSADAPWLSAADAAFGALLATPDAADLPRRENSGRYRERLGQAFLATWPLPAAPAEAASSAPAEAEPPPPAARVALMVPPHLAYEPAGAFLERMAHAYGRLVALLERAPRLGTVTRTLPGGQKAGPVKAEAEALRALYRGAWLLVRATPPADPVESAALARAEAFLSGWRTDVDLQQDVRLARALPGGGAVLVHGVSRQELKVGWARLPRVESMDVDPRLGLYAERRAAQRYLLPLLVTGHLPELSRALPDRAGFQSLSDKQGRRPSAVEAALSP